MNTKGRPPSPKQPSPVQRLIARHLGRTETPWSHLAIRIGFEPTSIYRMLRRSTNNWNVERMLAACGARITLPKVGTFKLGFDSAGRVDEMGYPKVVLRRLRRKGSSSDEKK